jgi:hypothetical protein
VGKHGKEIIEEAEEEEEEEEKKQSLFIQHAIRA